MVLTEKTAFLLAIVIYIVFIIILTKKHKSIFQIFLYSIPFFYVVGVIAFAIFPISFDSRHEIMVNLDLFHTYYDIEKYQEIGTPWKSIQAIIGNFLLLFPAGIFIPILFPKIKKGLYIILIGLGISFGIEFLQLLQGFIGIPLKIFDIDDILLNTLGYILGFMMYIIFHIKE